MAELEQLMETKELKTTLWAYELNKEHSVTYLKYNKKVDTLTLLVVPKDTPTIVHYIDEHVALLYQPDSRQIVGVRVEAFQRSFLPKYDNLQRIWRLSDSCELENFGDLIIASQKYEHKEPEVARELTQITQNLVEKKGFRLPVPA